jgi:tetratricopeptide (TPR) repeat protein
MREYASNYLKQAISLNDLNVSKNALTNLGLVRRMSGEYTSAKEALREAISREDNDGNAEAKHYLILLYLALSIP